MRVLLNLLTIFILLFSISGNTKELDPAYTLNECVVKVDLQWPINFIPAQKHQVLNNASTYWNKTIASNEYPPFSLHFTRSADYYMVYFSNKCTIRKSMTETILKNKIKPNVNNFPHSTVSISGFEIGFDGVKPSGWWKDR